MRYWIFLTVVLLCFAVDSFAQENELTRLLRFPDVSKTHIAFVYAGDIWVTDINGGTARRLTSHEGTELFPKFSPDGKWIAFSAEYSGSRQIYAINVEGGDPRQLTFYNDVGPLPPRGGYDNQVLDWSPDGKNILFRGNRVPWGERMGRPYVVPFAGGMETPLAIPESGGGMFSPDGTKMVYTPIERENRTWKRYRGGRAQDVWIYDLKANTSEKITDYVGTDNQPMWVGDKIYFTSDREHTLNLYCYDLKTRQTRKVTNHNDYDVLWPAASQDYIVYQCGGYVYRFDPKTENSQRVAIRVYGDLPQTMASYRNVRQFINGAEISPSGARALFAARGDLFTVPAKDGEIRNLTQTPGIRELNPIWSPDGKFIAYWSDRTGEYELYVRKQDGIGEERRVTTDGDIWRFPPIWSPNSRLVAFADKKQRLRYVDVETGVVKDVDHGQYNDITYYRWAPDNRWLVYTKDGANGLSTVWVYSLPDNKTYQLTSGRRNDYEPVFDPKGRYLYFLSDRDFNLNFSSFEFNYLYDSPTRVYVALLNNDSPALFQPLSDEEKASADKDEKAADADDKGKGKAKGKEKDSDKDDKDSKDKKLTVKIDPVGFENRVRALPVATGNYGGLSAIDSGVIYINVADSEQRLRLYNIDTRKEDTIVEGVFTYDLSADQKKLLVRRGQDYAIISTQPGQKIGPDNLLNFSKLEMKVDPRAEWKQVYWDGWRILRDWFYDPNMHGVDWKKLGKRYEELVPFIATRADLDFVLGELGGELNAGHVYVNSSPDQPRVDRINGGLLGAEIVAHSSGYFQIDKIFPGENWHDNLRSPLTEPGVKARKGDFILAVNGRSTKEVKNFYELMENSTNRTMTLLINDKPSLEGAHEAKVRPIVSETSLRYYDWVESRRQYVEKLSNGRIGYIHVPNTAVEGNRELFKGFYEQFHKDALIIDDRYNGGGFIPDRMVELLDRPVLQYWARRGIELQPVPNISHQGPKAMLINGYSSSGGDALPYYFRKRGLGKLIGTRTWGGLIGLSGNPGFIDNGSVSVPTFRFLGTDGMWDVENIGVAPDVEVVDRPELIHKGQDPSLEKAIEMLMEELRKNPPVKVKQPPAPDESK
jgi:tricorn protease